MERTPVKLDEIKVQTIIGGIDYRVTLRDWHVYRFVLTDVNGTAYVDIHSKASRQGMWALSRFGEKLSPATIRSWITENVVL